MRRRILLGLIALALAAGVLFLLRPTPPPAPPPQRTDEGAAELTSRLLARASATAAPLTPKGDLELPGTVLGVDGAPAGGVEVVAFEPEAAGSVQGPCACRDRCGRTLDECLCSEGAWRLLELSSQRAGEAPPIARTLSEPDGSFVLRGLEQRVYSLFATSPTGVAELPSVLPGAGAVTVTLGPGRRLLGQVRTRKGKPIPDALVTAIPLERARYFDQVAGSDGRFALGPVPPGAYLVVAASGSLLPAVRSIRATETEPFSLVLEEPRRISGKVYRGGAPVADAKVTLSGQHRGDEVRSAADGSFAFSRLSPGPYTLNAAEGGEAGASSVTANERDADEVVIELGPSAAIAGVVKDDLGVPVEGALVQAELEQRHSRARQQAVTDAEGRFAFPAVPAGPWMFSATSKRHLRDYSKESAAVEAVAGETVQVELTVKRAAQLEGVVVDASGAAVADVELMPDGEGPAGRGTSDARGEFSLATTAGKVTLTARHPAYRVQKLELVTPVSGVKVVLDRGLELSGVVLDPFGAPAPDCLVVAFPRSAEPGSLSGLDEAAHEGQADTAGRFTLGGLAEGELLVIAASGLDTPTPRFGNTRARVPARGPITVKLNKGHSISGLVVDGRGTPVADAELSAMLENANPTNSSELELMLEGGLPFGKATTEADGSFEIRSLKEGQFELKCELDGYLTRTQRTRSGVEGLRVVLERRPHAVGRVVTADGAPVKSFTILGRPFEVADGRFEFPLSGAASKERKLTLVFDAGPRFAPTTRIVEPRGGGDVELGDVLVTAGSSVSGTVVDAATRLPIAGALVQAGEASHEGDWQLSVSAGAARTDALGAFTLDHLETDQPRPVRVVAPGYERLQATVGPRQPNELGLRKGASVRGVVRLADGGQLEQGTVFLTDGNALERADYFEDGRFEIGQLPAGHYVLSGVGGEGVYLAHREFDLASGQQLEVNLESRRGVDVRFRVEGAGDPERVAVQVLAGNREPPRTRRDVYRIRPLAYPAEEEGDHWVARQLPPGEYTVFATEMVDDGFRITSTRLTVTGEAELVIRFPPDAVRFSLDAE